MVPSPRPHRTNKDQETLEELLSSQEFYLGLNQYERQVLIDSLGLVTVPTGNTLYPQESQDEEEDQSTSDVFILFRGSLSSGDSEYRQQGEIIRQGNIVSLEDSAVWRIRGDVIDRLALKDKLFPRFHIEISLDDLEESKTDVHVADPDTIVNEPQLESAQDLDQLMKSSSLHFENPVSLDVSQQDSLVMFHQPDGASAYNSVLRDSISALPGFGHQQEEHYLQAEIQQRKNEDIDAHSHLQGAIGAYFDRQDSEKVLLDDHIGDEVDPVAVEDEESLAHHENHDRLEYPQAHKCEQHEHEQQQNNLLTYFNTSQPAPLEDNPLMEEDPQPPLQPVQHQDMSHLQPINSDTIHQAAYHQDSLSSEELYKNADLATDEQQHDNGAVQYVSQADIRIAFDEGLPEEDKAEEQASPSRDVEDYAELQVQAEAHQHQEEGFNHQNDDPDFEVNNRNHGESHGIHEGQEPRNIDDEPLVQEPEAHECVPDMHKMQDFNAKDSDRNQEPDQDLSQEIDIQAQSDINQSQIIREEIKLEGVFSAFPANSSLSQDQTGLLREDDPLPDMDADLPCLNQEDDLQLQEEHAAMHESAVSNNSQQVQSTLVPQDVLVDEAENNNFVEPDENIFEKAECGTPEDLGLDDFARQIQFDEEPPKEIKVGAAPLKEWDLQESKNVKEEEVKEALVQWTGEEGIGEEFKTFVSEHLPQETDQAPIETVVAQSEERNIDQLLDKGLEIQQEESESSQEFQSSHHMQLPQQTQFDEDHYRISDEGDTHLNFQSQTAVTHSEVDDFHHVPTDQETKRMSISMQHNQKSMNRSQIIITTERDRESPDKGQHPIHQEDRISTLEVDLALHQTNLPQQILIKNEGSTQTDFLHTRDQEVQALNSVHHQVWTQVEEVIFSEKKVQTDIIVDSLPAETLDQEAQTDRPAETPISTFIQKIQEQLEVMPQESQISLISKLQNTIEAFVQLTNFRQHINHEEFFADQPAPSNLTISSQKQSSLTKALVSENQLKDNKRSPHREDLTSEALRLRSLYDTIQTSLASDYNLIKSVLATDIQEIEPAQSHTDLITVVRPKRISAAQGGLKPKLSLLQQEKKEQEFKARVEQQYQRLMRYISEDSQQDVALEKSAMFIFVAQQILAKKTKTIQTFDQLKVLLGSLYQEEAVIRILQVKTQGFTLRAELVDKLIDLYACLKKDSNVIFHSIISEEIGPMVRVPKEKREEPLGVQVVRKKRAVVNAGINDGVIGFIELGPSEKMYELETPENTTGSVLFVEKRISTSILNQYGSIVDIPLTQDLLKTDQQQLIDYSEAPILNVQSSSSGVVVDHLKTSSKKGGADRKLKDYLSRNNKKGSTLQSEPPFQTINQGEGQRAIFNHYPLSEDGDQFMMTGDFRQSYDMPKKHSSPGKRRTAGLSLNKRLIEQSPGRFGGSQYQKPESIDVNTAGGHSRNESKSKNVFNSKVSEALRSGGGFSSNRGLPTPVGFSLTQNTGSSTMSNQRVLDRLRGKVAMKLSERIPCLSYGNILTALKESSVDDYIKKLLLTDKLQIVDQTNSVVLDKEVKEELGIIKMSNHKSPTRKSQTVQDPTSVIKISDISSKAKTSLKISDKNMKTLEVKVRDYFKTPKVPVIVGQATLTQNPLTARR